MPPTSLLAQAPIRHLVAWGLASAIATGCAGPADQHVDRARSLIEQGRHEDGLSELERAVAADPGQRTLRMELIRQRELSLSNAMARGNELMRDGKPEAALAEFEIALRIAPANPRAMAGAEAARAEQRWSQRVAEAGRLADRGEVDAALRRLSDVLTENPAHAGAKELHQRLAAAATSATSATVPQLQRQLRKAVSVEFRDAPLRSVFDGLARGTGINFVFDRDVRSDLRISVSISDVSIDDAVGTICASNQLARKVLNDNTILIYPNLPNKRTEHQELAVKTFFLSNTEAKSVLALLKSVLKTRDVYSDDKSNTVTMRDTPDAIRLAEKIVSAQDQPEPEVLLDVEILEVKRSRLTEIGIEPPGKFTVLNLVRNPATVVSTATGNTTVENNTLTSTQLTLDKLRGLTGASIGIDNPSLNLRAENGDANLLANPRIRVRNRDKARILIGDRVPVITTVSTANVGVAESVTYLDVGLKLEVEPNLFLDNEVGIKINLEVSNLVREVRSRSGTLTYQIGTRLASTSLRLKDGETQALAGLISDEDRSSAVGTPGMIDLPLVGRLFSSHRGDRSKTEIVLLVTPRVVRNHDLAASKRHQFASGTESSVGAPPVRIEPSGRMRVDAIPSSAPRISGAAPGQSPLQSAPPPTEVPNKEK